MRLKRPRSRVESCALFAVLSLTGLFAVASPGIAQTRVPVRDRIVAPGARPRVPADSTRDSTRLIPGSQADSAARDSVGARSVVFRRDTVPKPVNPLLLAAPDLAFRLNSRLEGKYERFRNDRCALVQFSAIGTNCSSSWTPGFNFQLDVLSKGTIADRVHVDLDFDSQREYDASNNISVRYEGKKGRAIEGIEIGNISFTPPVSRFITSGIPSGNYGVLARGRVGALTYTGVIAQQKGNVIKDRTFMIGDRALQQQSRALEDVGMELRRFFLTVDPRRLPGYPNIDILNRAQMLRLAASLPDSVRPSRLFIYKQLIGAINPNPRGPQLSVRGARNNTRQIYEVLRENVDYYVDPSQLWIALVAPLAENERLAVAYEVNINGVPGRSDAGGTPDVEYTVAPQVANLLWEPELQPTNQGGYFQREIKSVYRLGGDEIRRESITMKIVTGTSGDQERPRDPSRGATYLQLFGMSQATNPGALDIENRVWPRPQDPNRLAGAPNEKLLRDNFVVFPSLQPFARAGLAQPFANPANDTLYTFPNEYLYSPQRPQSIFRMQTSYVTEGFGSTDALEIGTQQIRPLSERVLLDGQPLVRDVDYTANYELGVINFNRADTLFLRPREVVVRFEENQPLGTSPISIYGLTSQLNFEKGFFGFTAISQQQRSNYNRPPLGLETAGSLVAGLTADFTWNATALTRAVSRLPNASPDASSRIRMTGELAVSKPRPNDAGQAYLATFEDNAGRTLQLPTSQWALSSKPAAGTKLASMLGSTPLTLERNSTLVFQNIGLDATGAQISFLTADIDPQVKQLGIGSSSSEEVMWMTLLPLKVGGLLGTQPGTTNLRQQWTIGNSSSMGMTPSGIRWGSLRTVLSPSGDDLSRIENIEFFVLIDTTTARRAKNPKLVFDFGDISENRVAFSPETLIVTPSTRPGVAPDTTYSGKRLAGYDVFDSERDRFSRAFNAIDNDVGIAGSVADTIIVVDRTGANQAPYPAAKVPICSAQVGLGRRLGDSRANCTVRNNRLDEEDIDLDGALNYTSLNADNEQWKRFIVELNNPQFWTRVGVCKDFVVDSSAATGIVKEQKCWVQVRLNWRAPSDSLNSPNDRRMRAMRMTMISAPGESDDAFTRIAISKFSLSGAPWLRRGDRPLSGMAGDSAATTNGYVISSRVGTEDASATVEYQPPPGVIEQSDVRDLNYGSTFQQVNEHSLRLQAGVPFGQFPVFARAESFYRIPQGNNTFMNYRTLRVWMRGRRNGWGPNGELNAYVKIGRDENNFYMYRTPVQSGSTVAAWEPEVRVNLERFQTLRAQLETNALRNTGDSLSCTGADLELIKRSGLPRGVSVRRYAVCQNGYIVYSADPGITPPNLAGVQELAVGFVRIDSVGRGGLPILANDTLELWVDDVRLSDVVADAGFAGEIGLYGNAGDVADFRLNLSRRDPNFRQLGETPSFLTTAGVSAGTTVHLERFLPNRWGLVMPLNVNYGRVSVEQLFINQTDVRADGIRGLRNPNDSRVDYSLSVRRGVPLVGKWYSSLVNGLVLSGIWGNGNGQSTYQKARNNNYAVNASLNLDGTSIDTDSSAVRLPRWFDWMLSGLPRSIRESESIRGLREQRLRFKPARFQIQTGVLRNNNATTSFLTPVALTTDSGVAVNTLSHVWQNSSTVEFRPLNAISASLVARQTLDLRDYDSLPGVSDSLNRARAANAERVSLFGMGMGLERDRSLGTSLEFRPGISAWFQPTIRFDGTFALYKDPNARALIRDTAGDGSYKLPKRIGAMQSLNGGVVLDPGRFIVARSNEKSLWNRFGRALQPVNANWNRMLTSNYDNTVLSPGAGYQFGLGGVRSFRGLNNVLATGAGRLTTLSGTAGVQLPLSFALRASFQQGNAQTWTRRVIDNFQALITSDNKTYPNAEASWRWTLAKPNKVFSGLTASLGYVITENNTLVVSETGSIVEESKSRSESQPLSALVNWTFFNGFRTGASLRWSNRTDSRPGSVTRNNNPLAQAYNIEKDFTLPEDWKARSKLRTSVSYDFSGAISVVEDAPSRNSGFLGTGIPSVLTNNGRKQLNFRADTDLSEVMSFSFNGAHTVVFDRNYNRQTSFTVFSTVLQLHFGAGEMK